jgi:hypothetical protein
MKFILNKSYRVDNTRLDYNHHWEGYVTSHTDNETKGSGPRKGQNNLAYGEA